MAERPVFIPNVKGNPVIVEMIEFQWNPGFSKKQKQKNVEELHKNAINYGISPVLEISTKSQEKLGISLSAFNLKLELQNGIMVSVESAFQSSKVFEYGGPFLDLLGMDGKKIKKDERLRKSGNLKRFFFENSEWNLEPKSSFYDWLYLNALNQNKNLSVKLLNYNGFTDIEFNPKKQFNCQARSAALFVSLSRQGILENVLSSKDSYLKYLAKFESKKPGINMSEQTDIFSATHTKKENTIIEILTKFTTEFVSLHWNKNRLEKYNVPKWIRIDNYHNSKYRNEYGCFALLKNEKIKLIGQPYIKLNLNEEKLVNFGEIIDNYLLSKKEKKHTYQDFDELYFCPIDEDLVYLSKAIKEYLINKKGIYNALPANNAINPTKNAGHEFS